MTARRVKVFELTKAGRVRKTWFDGPPRRHISVLVCAEKMDNDFEIETERGIIRGRAGDFLVMDTTGDSYYAFPQEMEPLFRPMGSKITPEELAAEPALAVTCIERTLKGETVKRERSMSILKLGKCDRFADWLTANRPGVMSVLKKLNTRMLGVTNISSSDPRMIVFAVLAGESRQPVTTAEARKLGMTPEEFGDFDRSVDHDNLVVIVHWQACNVVFDEAADEFVPVTP